MRKYSILLVLLFTLLLLFVGIKLPSLLLNRQQISMMSESGGIDNNLDKVLQDSVQQTPLKPNPDMDKGVDTPPKKSSDQSFELIEMTDNDTLTVKETFMISKNYNRDDDWIFHAPKKGQLSLHEATVAAMNIVSEFQEQKMLPSFFLEASSNNTKGLLATKAASEPDSDHKMGCWMITFTSEDQKDSLELYLNAVTGQVLQLTAASSSNLHDDSGDTLEILDKYVDYLSIDPRMEEASLWSDDSSAAYYFTSFQSGITVKKMLNSKDNNFQLMIKIS